MSLEGELRTVTKVAPAAPDYADIRVRLEGVLRRICPAWLSADRDDLVQDAVIRVMEIVGRSEQSRAFSSSYLWRTAQSTLIDELRRRRRRAEVDLEDDLAGEPAEVGDSPGPARLVQGRELGREIWSCLGGLVRPRKLAVTLHLEGYSASEASRLLGWDTKRVYNLVHRGMQDLRECLKSKGLAP